MSEFAGKTAFVTGAASGIGRSLSQAFAQAGANVVLADIDIANAEATAADLRNGGHRAIAIELDVRSPDAWTAAADRAEAEFGNIHYFCNNAGTGSGPGAIEDRSLEDYDWVMSINARGMFIGARTLLPRMKAHGEPGHIVVTSSVMGAFATRQTVLYAMSKYAAAALGEVLFLELKGTNIGASVLCPGTVKTALLTSVSKNLPSQRGSESIGATASFIEAGVAPEIIADYVLGAIKTKKFYIFTHPEYKTLVAERFDKILNSFGDAADPSKQDNMSFYPVTYNS